MKRLLLCVALMANGLPVARAATPPQLPTSLMTPQQLQSLPVKDADYRLKYGDDPNQFGELRVPSGSGMHPVVVLIHGGCWKEPYATLRELGPMGDRLKTAGIASWNIEYRRLHQSGSGWPGTYLDVAHAVDFVRTIADKYRLDLRRIVVLGHSAGGHLAMWTAIRPRIDKSSSLFVANPLRPRGVINLAGTVDMTDNISNMEAACGDNVVKSMLGDTPDKVSERYKQVSAISMLPLAIPQALIWGQYEQYVPHNVIEKYVRVASEAHEPVRLITVKDVGHFELASPQASSWPVVLATIRSLLDGKLP